MKHFESSGRSLTKTITYRLLIIISTFIISFIVTRDIRSTAEITSVAAIANTMIYFLHERLWSKVSWGRKK